MTSTDTSIEPAKSNHPIGVAMTVDDDHFDQMLSKRVLDRSGAVQTLLQFHKPEEALEFLRRKDRPDVDIILLDVNMPRMNGFEFLEAATRHHGDDFAKCVVVMLTTSLDPKDQERANGFSVVKDYLTKPLVAEDVPRLVELVQAAAGTSA